MSHRGRHSADLTLAAELAAGRTVRDAAAAAGVSEKTAHRRLGEPAFAARVAGLRQEMVRQAAGRLAADMGKAAGVLATLLDHPCPDVKHKAAVKLLELGLRVREAADLGDRLAALEARLAADQAAEGQDRRTMP